LQKTKITETLLLKDLGDSDWQKYFDMMQEVRRKYYPGDYNPENTPGEMKNEWFTYYEAYKAKSFEQFAIFVDLVPRGWIGFMLDSRSGSFNFEADGDEFTPDILNVMLRKVYEFMEKNQLNDIYHWTFAERKIAALKGINAPIHEEMINTKVDRNEMNRGFYDSIISDTDITSYRLMFYEELPEELLDSFTVLMYDILDDYWSLNPLKQERKHLEKEDWLLRDRSEKLSGAVMQMYMLLTPANEIAAYCSLYIDKDNKETIRHGGGFTAVARAHRGKGFASFLKAKMYTKLLDENKDFTNIETDTMPWNTYMYRINQKFRFKPFRYGYDFKLTKEFIKNYLIL
jgi:RimJ/RimL family protein N-acetyltransferase